MTVTFSEDPKIAELLENITKRLDRFAWNQQSIEITQQTILIKLRQLAEKETTIMANETDLKAAMDAEGLDVQALTTSLPAYIAAVGALTVKAGQTPDLSAEVAEVQAHDAQVQAAVQGLSAALTPAPATTPTTTPPAGSSSADTSSASTPAQPDTTGTPTGA